MLLKALKEVFQNLRYVTLSTITGILIFVLSTWLPNLRFVRDIVFSSTATFVEKINILFSLTGSIKTNFTLFTASYTIAIAILFGVNVAMIVYYIKRERSSTKSGGVKASAGGVGGLLAGLFGIGCAACGTLVLGPLLTLIGLGGFLALLPFNGVEFGILGIIILMISIFYTAKRISTPIVCKIKTQ